MRSANRNGTHASRCTAAARDGHGTVAERGRAGWRIRRRAAIALLALGAATAHPSGRTVPPAFEACTDFHCDVTAPVSLTGAQWRQVRTLFRTPSTPARERAAIRRAVARLETLTGGMTGTWRDRGRNHLLDGRAGQLDCIAESRNTTTYLQLLEHAGLLRWHSVEERALRRRWLVSDHWTAVIRERATGRRFAVDSWYLDNGMPPCIQPLADWRDGEFPAACAAQGG